MDAPKAEAQEAEAPKPNDPKAGAPRSPGKVMIIFIRRPRLGQQGRRPADWGRAEVRNVRQAPARSPCGRGGVGSGAACSWRAGTAGLRHLQAMMQRPRQSHPEASVARIDADILALKASVEAPPPRSV